MNKDSLLLKITVLCFSATLAGCMVYKISKAPAPEEQQDKAVNFTTVPSEQKAEKRTHLSGSKSIDAFLMKQAYSKPKKPSKGNGAGNGSSTRTNEDFIEAPDFSNKTKNQP